MPIFYAYTDLIDTKDLRPGVSITSNFEALALLLALQKGVSSC